tara:strand:+ start:204 stop:632 length:429 start_codon:yes stop_codon:yes gene_type:complete
MRFQLFFGHLFTLIIGGLIYILFRVETLKMFKFFDLFSIGTQIDKIRVYTVPYSEYLPNWFLFSLPDGLWIFSYTSLVLYIWKNKLKKENIFWVFIVPFISIFSELGQIFNIIPGTFDLIDLIFYLIGFLLPFFIYEIKVLN